jgi:hypothetical protein
MVTIPVAAVDSAGTLDLLRNAALIEVFNQRNKSRQILWGLYSRAPGRAPGAPPLLLKQVRIEATGSRDEIQLAVAAVERAKGFAPGTLPMGRS